MRTLASLGDLSGRTVIVRCDLNVPMKNGLITDDGRIRASLASIRKLHAAGAKVVLISHLGRPEGRPDAQFSLEQVARRLSELLDEPVTFATDTVGVSAHTAVQAISSGQTRTVLLENLRFNPGETSKDSATRREFASELATFADAYVSDGFGVVHRRQASVTELAELLPSAAGLLVESELGVLTRLTSNPARPYTVALGGSKVSDKLGVIDHLLSRVDTILIGGGMLFTFLAARGYSVGASLLEEDQIGTCLEYLNRASELGVEIALPTDVIVAERFAADAAHEIVEASKIEESRFGSDAIGLDIGPATASRYAEIIRSSQTVFWNGPMGVFEFEEFSAGTRAVAQALTEVDGLAVVGGGDSAAAVRLLGFEDDQFGHISTGGGASLEFLEGKSLPGLEVLGWQ